MSPRLTRIVLLATAASVVLCTPAANGAGRLDDPACAALEHSVLPAPEWYADRCLGGAAVRDYSQYRETPGLVPGDTAFYKNIFPAPLQVKTAPLATLNFTVVGPNTRPLFAMSFNPTADTLYAVDNTTRQLGTINQSTGAFTSIATLTPDPGAAFAITGLTFDPVAGDAYLSATDGFTSMLFRINTTSAALTTVGPITGFPFIVDIAVDRLGQMFGHDVSADVLIRIDKATGTATLVGSTGMNANFGQGMMYDPSDDTLYGCAFVITPMQQGQLVRFNKTTGLATVAAGPVPDQLECAIDVPAVRMTPTALAVDASGNRVMDPGETATMAPTWRNDSATAQANVTGTLSAFTGPAGPTYTINDGSAAYGTIAASGSATCTDCYSLTASAATRPAQHWDTTVNETLSVPGQAKTWTLHIGGSFADVPASSPFYRFVETLFHRSITGGCSPTSYCPLANTTREQMAVFVLVSKEGSGYLPPACSPPNTFVDVPETSPFCRFIEELATRGVVAGCGGGAYCPTADVSREQMAIFVLRTLDPALSPPACTTPMFTDVPASSPFCRWIEELARRGVVTGCGGGAYCPTAPVTREQMGVFLTVTFGLTLYGVS